MFIAFRNMPTFGANSQMSTRAHELDGLRGWAALSVLFFHLTWEYFGVIEPGLRNPLSAFFFNGYFAIMIFFVLSGAALSTPFFSASGLEGIKRLAIKRYPRLVIPILASALIFFGLARLGWLHHEAASVVIKRTDWIGSWFNFPFTIEIILWYAFVDVFVTIGDQYLVNPILWTMMFELIGSAIVFAILSIMTVLNPSYRRSILLLLMAVMLELPPTRLLAAFVAGIILADWRASGVFEQLRSTTSYWLSWVLLVSVALVGAGCPQSSQVVIFPILAIIFVFAIFANESVCRFLANPISQKLGRLSFPLYLVHMPVIASLTCWLTVQWSIDGSLTTWAMAAIVCISTIVSLVAAVLFQPVEDFTQRFCNLLVCRLTSHGNRSFEKAAPAS
jgi:peptidoglycan/LPS O-acetylase OafA/YrhL